jgi:hypothetical protein
MLVFDYDVHAAWRFKNPDTHYNDHDIAEANAVFTYFTSKECKFGFFVQPNYEFAINNSKSHGVSMHDDNYYTFGTGVGFIWNIKPGYNINLKWEHDWVGRGLINGGYAPKVDAVHFMGTYSF